MKGGGKEKGSGAHVSRALSVPVPAGCREEQRREVGTSGPLQHCHPMATSEEQGSSSSLGTQKREGQSRVL